MLANSALFMSDINHEYAGLPLPEAQRSQFADLKETREEILRRVQELEARKAVVEAFVDDPKRTQKAVDNAVHAEAPLDLVHGQLQTLVSQLRTGVALGLQFREALRHQPAGGREVLFLIPGYARLRGEQVDEFLVHARLLQLELAFRESEYVRQPQ